MQVTGATRQKWSLTKEAFDGLLAALGPDRESAGRLYLRIRRDLVRLFEWRGCFAPDDYADETMNRCARKIAEGDEIRDLTTYAIGVARMLLREMARDRARHVMPLNDVPEPCVRWSETTIDIETRVESLRRSLARLSAEDRHLILNYYEGDKSEKIGRRKMLMEQLCITASTLRMRALRVREKLQLDTKNNSPIEESGREDSNLRPPAPKAVRTALGQHSRAFTFLPGCSRTLTETQPVLKEVVIDGNTKREDPRRSANRRESNSPYKGPLHTPRHPSEATPSIQSDIDGDDHTQLPSLNFLAAVRTN